MRKLSILIYFLISNCLAQNIDFSIIGNWQEIEYRGNNGATDYINKIENGRVFIFETNNIIKDTKGNIGTYQLNELKLHISLLNDERFYKIYYEKNNNKRLSLIPVSDKFEYICDEGCSEIFQKLDNAIEIKNRTVYGIVKDSLGTLPGVLVMVEGTKQGISTDFDGCYSIKAKPNEILIYSFVGKKTQRIIASKTEINVELKNDGIPDRIYLANESTQSGERDINLNKWYNYKINCSAKYNFNFNSKNNNYVIYVPNKEKSEYLNILFQEKFNVKYSLSQNLNDKYYKKHNKLTFKYLNKKYNKTWQNEIRKDAIGLDKFIK